MPQDALDAQTVLKALARSPLFAGLQPDELSTLLPQFKLEYWAERTPVMPTAATAERFYVLIEGKAKVEAYHPDNGRSVTLFLLGPGDGHNLVSLLDNKPHDVQAVTLEPTAAASASLAYFKTWLETYPSLRQAVVLRAARQLRDLSELAENLALHPTSARLAHLLLRHFDAESEHHNLIRDLVHEDIAGLIGSVRVVVNRLINRFKREGIIKAHGRSFYVNDFERLLEKAERRLCKHDGPIQPGNAESGDPLDGAA
ncbi:MAG: Crp/Fnr family transcriptional regulator [Betaproteobacteria bacterium]|nr:Crp/Fnr family transcriptional regulator [Betaproteobacteria bacterium]